MPFRLTFDQTVDIGAFLTFVTLVAGFLAWCFKTVKEWRRDTRSDARSGALRLLLKILRERHATDNGPISLADLRAEFESPARRSERKAYCDRDFRFKEDAEFESAIYRLQWESKIDFAAGDRILFRTTPPTLSARFRMGITSAVGAQLIISSFESALADQGVPTYDAESLGRLAAAANPSRTQEVIEHALERARDDHNALQRLLLVASRFSD